MRGRIRGVSSYHRENLSSAWQFCPAPADSIAGPAELQATSLPWLETTVPTTAAASLSAAGRWSLDGPSRRFDAEDWWYRCRFRAPDVPADAVALLGLDGLATVAEVWLNGAPLLSSGNMFVAHSVPVTGRLQPDNELTLRFRSLDKLLAAKRPRPRWRAPMIENQQLRWFRTTVLGRTPGWSPPAAVAGPWQPVWLETRRHFSIDALTLNAALMDARGIVDVTALVRPLGTTKIASVRLTLERAGRTSACDLNFDPGSGRLHGRMSVARPDLWWPHTHGEPATYRAQMIVKLDAAAATECVIDLGPIGFRSLALDVEAGNFRLDVNGQRVFCRGACWTPLDVVTLRSDRHACAVALAQVREAGMNMLRVGGTMVYESDDFLDLCDENGILLWQDFMFANMDYPADDTAFVQSVETEVTQQLARLGGHPCLAILCGNSEVEQQAAMWGATRDKWAPSLFHERLPAIVERTLPGVPYWPSSAHGGAFPHDVSAGSSSYYGVGAYLRPVQDARRSELRFASECLAFANVPEDETLEKLPNGLAVRAHHPEWKARTPRDLGAGWDFDDVRDFYLRELLGSDPLQLRYADHDRYLQLGRIASAEVMASCFAEWRRRRSTCNGALIWFLRDFWPGAGWGVIDACGEPKAAYYQLRRALQPVAISISDEGCSGLALHVVNDRAAALDAQVEMILYRDGRTIVARSTRRIAVAACDALELPAAALFDGFHDLSYAYRFGPPAYDVAVATLQSASVGQTVRTCYFPAGLTAAPASDLVLSARASPLPGDAYRLTIAASRFARWVTVKADAYRSDDQYFHVLPGEERCVVLTPLSAAARQPLRGLVRAVNAMAPVSIELNP